MDCSKEARREAYSKQQARRKAQTKELKRRLRNRSKRAKQNNEDDIWSDMLQELS